MDNGPSKRRRGQNQGVGATAGHVETEHNNRVPRVPGLDQSLVMWAELDSDLSRGPERYQDPEDRNIAETYCTNNVTYKKLRTDAAARQQRDTEIPRATAQTTNLSTPTTPIPSFDKGVDLPDDPFAGLHDTLQKYLVEYMTDGSDDARFRYGVLKKYLDAYATPGGSFTDYPFNAFPLPGRMVPITWEEVERWSSSGVWVDASVIDFFVLETRGIIADNAYKSTSFESLHENMTLYDRRSDKHGHRGRDSERCRKRS
jgi:hypothetical protein